MGRFLTTASLLFVLTLMNHVFEIKAECCYHCTTYCCSHGPCNIFCCNCEYHDPVCLDHCLPAEDLCWGAPQLHPGRGKTAVGHQHRDRVVQRSSLRSASTANGLEVTWQMFNEVDADGNGVLAFREAIAYLESNRGMDAEDLAGNRTWWEDMDTDNNGHLEPREFDLMLL